MSSCDPVIKRSIEENIRNMNMSHPDVAFWYANIAIAQMMYEEYLEKQKLKSEIAKYEAVKESKSL